MSTAQANEFASIVTPYQLWLAGKGPRAKPMYTYIASSWRNPLQTDVVASLKSRGLDVYDFRNPGSGNNGFSWREIHPDWQRWTSAQWREALSHPIARAGFRLDKAALDRADCVVLVLPAGRSAHLEAAYAAGLGKPVVTLALEPVEPELMNLLLGGPDHICITMGELFERLGLGFGPDTRVYDMLDPLRHAE